MFQVRFHGHGGQGVVTAAAHPNAPVTENRDRGIHLLAVRPVRHGAR
jgi:hypothetical protein